MARDIHLQLIDPSEQQYGANFTWGSTPRWVAGLQKLANHWVKRFLTPKGSHPWRPLEGTKFTYLLGGNMEDVASLQVAVLEAIDDATDQMRALQSQQFSLPADERVQVVNLVQFLVTGPTSADIWVEIVNRAGSRLTVLIPYARI
jgi:hypothetical protein